MAVAVLAVVMVMLVVMVMVVCGLCALWLLFASVPGGVPPLGRRVQRADAHTVHERAQRVRDEAGHSRGEEKEGENEGGVCGICRGAASGSGVLKERRVGDRPAAAGGGCKCVRGRRGSSWPRRSRLIESGGGRGALMAAEHS